MWTLSIVVTLENSHKSTYLFVFCVIKSYERTMPFLFCYSINIVVAISFLYSPERQIYYACSKEANRANATEKVSVGGAESSFAIAFLPKNKEK